MTHQIPHMLVEAIKDGVWKTPDPDVLRRVLGDDLPDIQLFEDVNVIEQMPGRLNSAGYVDDPEFCMVRESDVTKEDPRLVFEHAVFIGGAIIPGDDVFVVVDIGSVEPDPSVLVFDWERSVPNRWSRRGTLSVLIREVCNDANSHDDMETKS